MLSDLIRTKIFSILLKNAAPNDANQISTCNVYQNAFRATIIGTELRKPPTSLKAK